MLLPDVNPTDNPLARRVPRPEDYPHIYTVDLASGEHAHEQEDIENE